MRGMQNGNLYNVLAAAVGMHGRIHEYDRFIVRRKAIGLECVVREAQQVIRCGRLGIIDRLLAYYHFCFGGAAAGFGAVALALYGIFAVVHGGRGQYYTGRDYALSAGTAKTEFNTLTHYFFPPAFIITSS